EVAVAAHAVGALEPPAEARACRVVEERRRAGTARQRAFLEPEHEHDVEASRPRAQQVEHRDAAGLAARGEAHLAALEPGEHVVARERLAETLERLELV